jgi:hypothetical protein
MLIAYVVSYDKHIILNVKYPPAAKPTGYS